jgi:hypothetical protein
LRARYAENPTERRSRRNHTAKYCPTVKMSGLATKQQSLKIFEKLKTKPANKASQHRTMRVHTDTLC